MIAIYLVLLLMAVIILISFIILSQRIDAFYRIIRSQREIIDFNNLSTNNEILLIQQQMEGIQNKIGFILKETPSPYHNKLFDYVVSRQKSLEEYLKVAYMEETASEPIPAHHVEVEMKEKRQAQYNPMQR